MTKRDDQLIATDSEGNTYLITVGYSGSAVTFSSQHGNGEHFFQDIKGEEVKWLSSGRLLLKNGTELSTDDERAA